MREGTKRKSYCLAVGLLLLGALGLTACGNGRQTSSVNGNVSSVASGQQPMTEEEVRQEIVALEGGSASLKERQALYEQLLAMDVFSEADYVELAQIYGDEGDEEKQRLMLSKVLRLYPSREYAEQVSAIIVRRDETNGETAGIMEQIMAGLEQEDVTALQSLVLSEEWHQVMRQGLAGIETRMQYQSGDNVLQVVTDELQTEMTWLQTSGAFYFYRMDASGMVSGSAVYTDGMYNGDAAVRYWTPDGDMVRSFTAALRQNLCVERITILYEGTEYSGSISADGATAEEQETAVKENGGVVYAYSEDGKSYLYQADADEDFKLDADFLGLPVYTQWP